MIDNTVVFQVMKELGRDKKGTEIALDLFFYKDARYGREDFKRGVANKDYPFRLCMWPTHKIWNKYAEGDDLYASYCKERKDTQPFRDQEYPLSYSFSSHAYYTLLDYALDSRNASDACNEILKILKDMRVSDEEQNYARKIANIDKEPKLDDLVRYIVKTAEAAAKRETGSRETQLSICARLKEDEKNVTKIDTSILIETNDFTELPKNKISRIFNKMDASSVVKDVAPASVRPMTVTMLIARGISCDDISAAVMQNDVGLYTGMPPEVAGTQAQWADIYRKYPDNSTFLTVTDEDGALHIIGNWTLVGLSRSQAADMENGSLKDIDLVIEDNLYSSGDHIGYLLNLSVNLQFYSMRVYRQLWETLVEFLTALAEEGSFLESIYTKVFRPDHETRYIAKGFTRVTADQFFGDVFKLDFVENVGGFDQNLSALYEAHFSKSKRDHTASTTYWIATPSSLMAEGFSEQSLALYLSEMYMEQRCAARQPMAAILEDPNTWVCLLRNPGNIFFLVVERINPSSADGTQKNCEEAIAPVGFLWAKKHYTDGCLATIPWETMEWAGDERLALHESPANALCILGFSLPDPERVNLAHQLLSITVFQQLKDDAGISHILVRALSGDEECFWQEVGFTHLGESVGQAQWMPSEAAPHDIVYSVIMGMCTDHLCSPSSDLTAYTLFHQNASYLMTSTCNSIKMLLTGPFGFAEVHEEGKTISKAGGNSIALHMPNSPSTNRDLSTKVSLSNSPPLEYVSIHVVSESGPYEITDTNQQAKVDALIAKLNFKLKNQAILREGSKSVYISYRTDLFLESPAELETLKDLIQGHFDMVSSAYAELACITDSPLKML